MLPRGLPFSQYSPRNGVVKRKIYIFSYNQRLKIKTDKKSITQDFKIQE